MNVSRIIQSWHYESLHQLLFVGECDFGWPSPSSSTTVTVSALDEDFTTIKSRDLGTAQQLWVLKNLGPFQRQPK